MNLGFVTFQPAEAGRILIVIFLASYLSQRREMLAAGVGPLRAAAAEGPRAADPARVGRVAGRAVPRARHGRVAAAVRRVRRDALGRDRPVGLPRARARSCSRSAPTSATSRSRTCRCASTRGCTRWTRSEVADQGYQLRRDGSRSPSGGMVGTGLGQGSPTLIPYVGQRLHPRGVRRGARDARRRGAAAAVPRAGRARAADRGRAPRQLREAARGRASRPCSGCRCS